MLLYAIWCWVGRLTAGINQTALLSLHNLCLVLGGGVSRRPNTFTRLNNNQREWAEPASQHSQDKVATFWIENGELSW